MDQEKSKNLMNNLIVGLILIPPIWLALVNSGEFPDSMPTIQVWAIVFIIPAIGIILASVVIYLYFKLKRMEEE